MNQIPYTYEVTHADEFGMVLLFKSPGYPDTPVGTQPLREGESLDALARVYAPINAWLDIGVPRVVPAVGTAGSYTPPPPPPAPTLADFKAAKLAELASWRYEKEVGGINLGGATIDTDRDSQGKITSAYVALREGMVTSIDFKAKGGVWVTLGIAEVEPMAQAVVRHIQGMFTLEKEIAAQIADAQTIEQVQAITFPEVV